MLRSVAATIAVALCLAAQPAIAEPFDSFVELCVTPGVDRSAAQALARSAGWIELPAEDLGGDMPFDEARLFLSGDPATLSADKAADLHMLVTGSGSGEEVFDLKDVRMDICSIGVLGGADKAALEGRLSDHFGFAPGQTDGDTPVWVFSPRGEQFHSRADLIDADDATFIEAARRDKIMLAVVMNMDGVTVLMLGAIRPSNAD